MGRIVHPRGRARISANLTPMIDLTFLLIVFFIVVSQIGDRQRVALSLPRPSDPVSAPPGELRRTTINLVPREDAPTLLGSVVAGGTSYGADAEALRQLAQQLAALYRANPQMRMSVRADRRLQYRAVEPILRAIADGAAQAGVAPRVNLVVLREGGSP
ncbi:MAG TPA: biopolymer transporter ExbD [Phycisphaerales bacterium]|nr:biopolymer transporter ExbD [Phycisphaerales bacterium]HMP35997.1 biopolymer transporter ExbD [Phycisphaerales bacterium]